jgi:hypothetical protein
LNEALERFESANLQTRPINSIVDDFLDTLEPRNAALVGLRSIRYDVGASNDFKICLLRALTSPTVLNAHTETRLTKIFRRLASLFLRENDLLEPLFDLALILRRETGVNLFRNNDCLLDLPNMSEDMKSIFMDGEIFAHLYIAESQNIFITEQVRDSLIDGDFELIERLRNYSEGVRAFWRQKKTLAYQYPLSFQYRDNLPFGFFMNSTNVERMDWIGIGFEKKIPRDIMDMFVSKYVMFPELYQLINDSYFAQPIISKMTESFGRVLRRNCVNMMRHFGSVGGFLFLAEDSLNGEARYPEIMHKIIQLGKKFLEFVIKASVASEPAAFNEVIDSQSANAAADCLGMFTRLEVIQAVREISDSFGHFEILEGLDTTRLIIEVENITASMIEINLALKERRQLGRSSCYNYQPTFVP